MNHAVLSVPSGHAETRAAPDRLSVARRWREALEFTARVDADPARLLADVIDEWAERHGDRLALLSDQESFSYRALAASINRYARWAIQEGIGVGDTVCLVMPNRPEYLAVWLGITRVGGIVALINPQLAGASLAHCVGVARARHLIVTADLALTVKAALADIDPAPRVWIHGGGADHERIDAAVARPSARPLSAAERRPITISDHALLIYTSGTTGMPKAAHVSHRRVMSWGGWFAGLTGATPDDRIYNCLPLYHSVGGVVATASMLVAGGSVVIAEKFSARRFWDDIVRWECTLFQYIGELCRYLLNAPPAASERAHRLRLGCGNGLRGDIWRAFQERFAIPRILEFYAATEGNVSLYNVEGEPGAVGRVPAFLAHRLAPAIVRFDDQAEAPVRGADGRCIRCGAGEVGEALGRIGESGLAFEGYTDRAETERKILRDVFEPGDAWFRTGDLMMRDHRSFYYFVDRVGDTFRWKGENVAASEVVQRILSCPGVIDASVYGVTIPGTEGRAGMAALVVGPGFDLTALREHLVQRLPAYACPLFVRIRAELEVTETFKQKKHVLVADGFDPHVVADPLYFNDGAAGAYVPLDAALYARLVRGAVRL
jgi:fatty-acyl-CoA synthase